MKKLSLILSSILILFLTFPSLSDEIKEITADYKKLKVIDGDTIKIGSTKIRLYGIDAPEIGQICINKMKEPYDCGLYSKKHLEKAIGKGEFQVTCVYNSVDIYKRILGICYRGIKNSDAERPEILNVNYFMVGTGRAVAYTKYSNLYFKAEKFARRSRRGIWQGEFDMPWDWRKKNR